MNIEIFSEAMNEINEKYIREALQYRKKPLKHSVLKWGAAAACLALLLVLGGLFFPFPGERKVSAYTYGTDEEITAAGLTLLTGAISDSGEMTGKPLTFYLSGEDISTVRFSCKNETLSFMDWTVEWPEYGKAGNFTVAYGEDESQYYYLVIDWEPDALIRELTDNPGSSIASLPEQMRSDLIVLEIAFINGKTATKAIQISLLDDGTFFASFDDYKISDADAFVRRPDSHDIPRSVLYAEETQVSVIADAPPMVYVGDRLYQQSTRQVFYEGKKEDFVYLGKVETDVTHSQDWTEGTGTDGDSLTVQHATDGIPRKNFQANHPIVGAEIYQYGDDIVVLIDGKYWLYEAVDSEPAASTQAGEQSRISGENKHSEEKSMLDPSYIASPPAAPEKTNTADGTPETQDAQSQISGNVTEEILSAAEEAARAYYAETVLEVVSMELKSQTEDTILFSVSVKKDGIVQEPERSITLQLILGTWEVVNEGY